MKYAIFSDVQGNYGALKRFFAETENNVDVFLCLGDIVQAGKSYDDNRCIDLIRDNKCIAVRGNHEDRVIANYTKSQKKISPDNIDYLASLSWSAIIGGYFLVHAPSGQRVISVEQATEEFKKLPQDIEICFFGHSHKASLFSKNKNGQVKNEGLSFYSHLLKDNCRYLINPGGIGLYFDLPQTYMFFDEQSRKLELRKIN